MLSDCPPFCCYQAFSQIPLNSHILSTTNNSCCSILKLFLFIFCCNNKRVEHKLSLFFKQYMDLLLFWRKLAQFRSESDDVTWVETRMIGDCHSIRKHDCTDKFNTQSFKVSKSEGHLLVFVSNDLLTSLKSCNRIHRLQITWRSQNCKINDQTKNRTYRLMHVHVWEICEHNKYCNFNLYLFMYTGVQYNFLITWCPCCLTVTRLVPLVYLYDTGN